ncbi:MAG: hypothetical protein WAZ34_11920 [Rhodocyclaceae bacterium]
MVTPAPDAAYLIELCSGEQRRWRDLETKMEFSEGSVMYVWAIVERVD